MICNQLPSLAFPCHQLPVLCSAQEQSGRLAHCNLRWGIEMMLESLSTIVFRVYFTVCNVLPFPRFEHPNWTRYRIGFGPSIVTICGRRSKMIRTHWQHFVRQSRQQIASNESLKLVLDPVDFLVSQTHKERTTLSEVRLAHLVCCNACTVIYIFSWFMRLSVHSSQSQMRHGQRIQAAAADAIH